MKMRALCLSAVLCVIALMSVPAVAATSSGPFVSSTAKVFSGIDEALAWSGQHDAGTPGSSSGTMSLVSSPSLSGKARKFVTSYSSYGGERYHTSLGAFEVAKNFVFDTYVYVSSGVSSISNVEMDLNQVIASGETVIYGFQCDGWSKTWDYTENRGTASQPAAHWMHSTASCDPEKWTLNKWHHIQISYSRDTTGNVTYKSVWFDGLKQQIGVTAFSAFGLGWGKTLLLNYQLDGRTSTASSSTTYLDKTTLYGW